MNESNQVFSSMAIGNQALQMIAPPCELLPATDLWSHGIYTWANVSRTFSTTNLFPPVWIVMIGYTLAPVYFLSCIKEQWTPIDLHFFKKKHLLIHRYNGKTFLSGKVSSVVLAAPAESGHRTATWTYWMYKQESLHRPWKIKIIK